VSPNVLNEGLFQVFAFAKKDLEYLPCVDYFVRHCRIDIQLITHLLEYPAVISIDRIIDILNYYMNSLYNNNAEDLALELIEKVTRGTTSLTQHETAMLNCVFDKLISTNNINSTLFCKAIGTQSVWNLLLSKDGVKKFFDANCFRKVFSGAWQPSTVEPYVQLYELAGKPQLPLSSFEYAIISELKMQCK